MLKALIESAIKSRPFLERSKLIGCLKEKLVFFNSSESSFIPSNLL